MNQTNKNKKFVSILSQISREKREKAKKSLNDHQFHLQEARKKANLFDYLIFQALMEQADSMSMILGKPHQYQVESEVGTRLGKEAYENLDKSAILRPTRLGPLSLIG